MEKELKVSDVLKKKGAGFSATLEVDLPDLQIVTAIRHETMNSKDIKEQHRVVFRDTAGKEVARKFVGDKKTLKWLAEDGTEAEGTPQAYQEVDGKETAVEPFEKSDSFKITKIVPKYIKDDFLLERTVEIWGEDQGKLYKLAEYLKQKDSLAVCPFVSSKGYDTQYLCLIEPRFIDDSKFGLIGYLAKKHLVFNHLLDMSVKSIEKAKPKALDLVGGIL
jgi:hypothetical protein